LNEGEKFRILNAVVGNEPVMIVIGSSQERFNDFVNEAARPLGSLKWHADVSGSAHSRAPNLVGKTYDKNVRAAPHFAVQVAGTKVTDKPKGTIVGQDPAPDNPVEKGSVIWVDVSAGQPNNPGDVYEDDFSDTSGAWPTGSNGNGTTYGYSDNKYYMSMEQRGNRAGFSLGTDTLMDSIIEVDATSTSIRGGKLDGLWGVTCRDKGDGNFYLLGVDSMGEGFIWRFKDGRQIREAADENDLTNSAIKHGTAALTGVSDTVIKQGTNHIRADCIENTLSLFVNGQEVAEAKKVDSHLGIDGLLAMNLGKHGPEMKVFFDNLQVSSVR